MLTALSSTHRLTATLTSLVFEPAGPPEPSGGAFGPAFIENLVQALMFSALGMVLFALFWFIAVRVTPFSVRKEIEDDQNTALAVVFGAMIIGIAMIVSAAILG